MSERKDTIRKHLESTRSELFDTLHALEEHHWDLKVESSEGSWTVIQTLMHLSTAERGQLAGAKRTLAGKGTARLPEGFDLDVWNVRQVEKRKDLTRQQMIDEMIESRKQALAWLETLREEDFAISGQHARGDTLTIEEVYYRIGDHESMHLADIKRALANSA